MVKLRDFVERLDSGERVAWQHRPVQPMLRRQTPRSGGEAVAVADKAELGADVRPEDADSTDPENEYASGASDDERIPAKRGRGTSPPRAGTDSDEGEGGTVERDAGTEGGADGAEAERVSCNRCGLEHASERCTQHERPRGAWNRARAPRGLGSNRLSSGGGEVFAPRSGSVVVRVLGDGSCLFRALTAALNEHRPVLMPVDRRSAARGAIADWLQANGDTFVSGVKLKDWIKWDSNKQWTLAEYVTLVRGLQFWGGELEIVACSKKSNVNVTVWREAPGDAAQYQRVAAYARGGGGWPTVHLLYVSGLHYDMLRFPPRPCTRGRAERGQP